MQENPVAGGYILCHQSLHGNKVVRQMRPLLDWSNHDWYVESISSKKAPIKKAKAKATKKMSSKK